MDIKQKKKTFQVLRQTQDTGKEISEIIESTKDENGAHLQKKTTRSFGNKLI